MKEHWIETLR